MHSISVVTPKVVFQCCYLALTLFSYRKANHFIDAAKLLFKVSIFLSSFTHIRIAGDRNQNIDLRNYNRTVNCMIPLSFAEGLLYVNFVMIPLLQRNRALASRTAAASLRFL